MFFCVPTFLHPSLFLSLSLCLCLCLSLVVNFKPQYINYLHTICAQRDYWWWMLERCAIYVENPGGKSKVADHQTARRLYLGAIGWRVTSSCKKTANT